MASEKPSITHNGLPFRQVHLDFHTSGEIPGIGTDFDPGQWQRTLREAAVDSITLFAKCHHGWSYHPTEVGRVHPHLDFDLLRAQVEAAREIGVRTPIYLSAGVDNLASAEHPEWREMTPDGRFEGWVPEPLRAGFHTMDFHSPYLDYLCEQIREVAGFFPDCDGIFLDIVSQRGCAGKWSLEWMLANGLNPESEADRGECARAALETYYSRTTEAARTGNPDRPVFHNSGHIPRGNPQSVPYCSHLELESLPTGGWGYDHFPLSAKYAANLEKPFMGMTGRFHTTWGEFGGYKHPNALRYECAAMLAFGARCSVGDQLPPNGALDPTTYRLIGASFREVRDKQPWCEGAEQMFDMAILSSEAENGGGRENPSDEGAARVLLESHFLFSVIDRSMDFGRFRALILPDDIRIDAELAAKLRAYLESGGRLVLSGESGLGKDNDEFALDIGAAHEGPSPCRPPDDEPNRGCDFVLPAETVRPDFVDSPMIQYEPSRRIRPTIGESLGDIFDPYFNRTWRHFCSHQHTPPEPEPSGYACGVLNGRILYFAHPVFRVYRSYGAVAQREFIAKSIRRLMGNDITVETPIPSTARVTLTRQPDPERYVLHLLYAPTVLRGGVVELQGGNASGGKNVQVIEDLPPLPETRVRLRLPETVRSVRTAPEGAELAFETGEDGAITLRAPAFACHQMLAFATS